MASVGGTSARIIESTVKVTTYQETYDRSYRDEVRLGEIRTVTSELDSTCKPQIGPTKSLKSPPPYVEQGSAVAQAWREITANSVRAPSWRQTL
jgi:hypothetical protein